MPEESLNLIDIIVPLEQSEDPEAWRSAIASILEVSPTRIIDLRLRKHSIDARARQIKVQLRIEYGLDQPLPPEPEYTPHQKPIKKEAPQIIIVGCGPAGIFAALRALELGYKPIILERGKDASSRRFDLAPILREGRVIEDSNYCFGEGGAGTFSDGKLYTRAKKRGPIRTIYETLVAHGAPPRILVDAHPHIGSNLLPKVVMALRETIRNCGGEVHFQTKVQSLIRSANHQSIQGVLTTDGREFRANRVILATGHSARDIYKMIADTPLLLEAKPFAVGVRIEHPQHLIDCLQYHISPNSERPHLLPAARYRVATKIRDRGVHSFCMCPGGFIVPAATENDEVVVNGMSLSRRDSPFANSGLVVTVEPEDTAGLQKEHGILAGIFFQKNLEILASQTGGGKQKAPAQRALDFVKGKESAQLPKTSYFPGITPAPLHALLPPHIAQRMREGLLQFSKSMPGYLSDSANLIGFETRTSSPLRIPRDDQTLQHPQLKGLYPCGEGAGYAGGIVSAAIDGLRCAEAACR